MFRIGLNFFETNLRREVRLDLCNVTVTEPSKINEGSIAATIETLQKALNDTMEKITPTDFHDFPVEKVILQISTHLQSEVEVNRNLYVYGLHTFGMDCFKPEYVFTRSSYSGVMETFVYGKDGKVTELTKFLTFQKEIFSIGLSDNNTQLEIGLCDVRSPKNLTIEQVSEIILLSEKIVLSLSKGERVIIHDFMYDLAGITEKGSTVEKDINLQAYGFVWNDQGPKDVTLVFSRNVGNVWKNFYYNEGCTADDLHKFLFE